MAGPLTAAGASAAAWSAPAAAASCAAAGAPRVLFPDDAPNAPTGPGALVWAASSACPGGAGARVQEIVPGGGLGAPTRPRSSSGALIAPLGAISAATSPHGQIAISGSDPRHPGSELLVQGRAGGRFKALLKGGPLLAPGVLATAYLGDMALLAPTRSAGPGALGVRIERWFANALGPIVPAGRGATGAVSATTVAMDFRSDAVVAWAQDGSIWVSDLPARRAPRPAQRLGPAGSSPHIAALLSDDNRAIVMWSQTGAGTTSVWLDYSAPGPRFGAPRLLEHLADPAGAGPPSGSPQLIRLSSESVMSAWSGAEGGRWVLRTAPIDQHGLQAVGTVALPAGDALLESLAPGPRGEAIALLAEPAGGSGPGAGAAAELWSVRGTETAGRTVFGAPEAVATAAPPTGAGVAIEPGGDRAIAAWQGPGGAIYYSLRGPQAAG